MCLTRIAAKIVSTVLLALYLIQIVPMRAHGDPPIQVYITQPVNGDTVTGTAWAVIWIDGASGSSNTYTLKLGGRTVGSTTTSSTGPVSIPFDTTTVIDGSQPLMAI